MGTVFDSRAELIEKVFYAELPERLQKLISVFSIPQTRSNPCKFSISLEDQKINIHCPDFKTIQAISLEYDTLSAIADFLLRRNYHFMVYRTGRPNPSSDWTVEIGLEAGRARLERTLQGTTTMLTTNSVFESLNLPTNFTLRDLKKWMDQSTVPLSLTPCDSNVTWYVNEGYASWTARKQSQWCCDAGNSKRFAEGELLKIITGLQTAKNNELKDVSFTADPWNMPGDPHIFSGDAKLFILDGREWRMLHSKTRERKSAIS